MAKATKAKATPKKAAKPVSPFAGAVKGIRSMNFDQRKKFFDEASKIHMAEQQHIGDGQELDPKAYDDLQGLLDKE